MPSTRRREQGSWNPSKEQSQQIPMRNAGQRLNAPDGPSTSTRTILSQGYTEVHVLNIKWTSHDLGYDLDSSYEKVEKTFQSMGFKVRNCLVAPSEDSESDLKRELSDFFKSVDRSTLHVVYYNGHAYVPRSTAVPKPPTHLALFSHNNVDVDDIHQFEHGVIWARHALDRLSERLPSVPGPSRYTTQYLFEALSETLEGVQQRIDEFRSELKPNFEISFKGVLDAVLDAEGDVLVFLECCDAGVVARAVPSASIVSGDYTKHAIVACREGSITYRCMTRALCSILTERRNKVMESFDNALSAKRGLKTAELQLQDACAARDLARESSIDTRGRISHCPVLRTPSGDPKKAKTAPEAEETLEKAEEVVKEAERALEEAKETLEEDRATFERMKKTISGTEIKEAIFERLEEDAVSTVRFRSTASEREIQIPLNWARQKP